jgi:hypothetical protein
LQVEAAVVAPSAGALEESVLVTAVLTTALPKRGVFLPEATGFFPAFFLLTAVEDTVLPVGGVLLPVAPGFFPGCGAATLLGLVGLERAGTFGSNSFFSSHLHVVRERQLTQTGFMGL